MKKIITAIGNKNLNEKLIKNSKYEVITKDIQYKEGILELLNINSNIDILIISEILEGTIEFKELINKILLINENIEIIVFLEKENKELKSFLFNKGIYKIFTNNEIDIDTFIINLEDNTQEKTQELNEEIRKLKQIIKDQQDLNTDEKNGKIIAITGAYGSGKSLISCILCKEFSKKKIKTLLIDFDIFNSSINIMYNVLKYKQNNNIFSIKEHIIKISKYEHLLCATDLIFSDENSIDYINLEKMLKEFQKEYDQIIIDTSSNFKYKYIKEILKSATNIIYIVVPTISEMKKALNLYEVYVMDFQIEKEKIKILVNKENNYSVDELIIAKIFNINKISGKIKYSENIEKNINSKTKKRNIKIDSVI